MNKKLHPKKQSLFCFNAREGKLHINVPACNIQHPNRSYISYMERKTNFIEQLFSQDVEIAQKMKQTKLPSSIVLDYIMLSIF